MDNDSPVTAKQKLKVASLLEWVSLASIVLFIVACFHIYVFYNLYDVPIFSLMDFSEAIPQAFQNLISVFGLVFVFVFCIFTESQADRPATYLYLAEPLSEGSKPELEEFLEHESAKELFKRKIVALVFVILLFLGLAWLSNRMEDLFYDPNNPYKHTGIVNFIETFARKNIGADHLIINLYWLIVVMSIYLAYDHLVVAIRRNTKVLTLLLLVFFVSNAFFSAYDKYVFQKRTRFKNDFSMTLSNGSTITSRKGFYYIGQTKNAIFFYNTKENRTTVYMMGDIASLKMLPTSIFY